MYLPRVAQSRNFAVMGALAESGDLLSVVQVADELGKPTRTVNYWITSGRLAAIKLGVNTAQYVITRAEVERIKAEIEAAA